MTTLKPKRLSFNQIKKIAEQLLEKVHPSLSIPIPIDEIIEITLGIRINTIPNLKNDFGIDGFIDSSFTDITVDDHCFNYFEERTRFTIAHELGHKILHERLYNNFSITNLEEYLNFQKTIPEESHSWMEYQANVFAACMLVPTKILTQEVNQAISSIKQKRPPIDLSIPYLASMPLKFKVSEVVLYKRIKQEKLLIEQPY